MFRTDPDLIQIQRGLWIRVKIINPVPRFRIENGNKYPQKRKSSDISCFEVLDVLNGGMEASPVA
jgi:hypothetical protein